MPHLDASKITSGTLSNSLVNWASPGAIGNTAASSGAFTTLTTTGNVGIGTTTPGGTLHIGSSASTNDFNAVFGNTATTYGLGDTVIGGHLMFAGTGRYNGNLTYYPSRSARKALLPYGGKQLFVWRHAGGATSE